MSTVHNKKVFVAMSGGVDSSVAAALLKKQRYEVIGAHMKCYNVDGCGEKDAEDARRAAETLGIPFYVMDFEEEYKKRVVEYMVAGYRQGITPNPDVMCNKEIKFGLFLKKALEMGADYVATGHYVRLAVSGERLAVRVSNKNLNAKRYTLYAAKDNSKDQSYFLWTLTQDQLRYCLFPIGDYLKSEVRELARKFGLPNAEKKDSQGICFLGQVSLRDFLKNYLPEKRGLVLNTAGRVIGEHKGTHFYTIGQRHLGVQHHVSSVTSNEKPLYIAEKDAEENAILVAGENDPALYQKGIELRQVNFINPLTPHIRTNKGYKVLVRVRYRQSLVRARLGVQHSASSAKLIFDRPQKSVAPGQSAVFYSQHGELLGGGIIVEN